MPQLINQVKQLQQTVNNLKNTGPPTNITSDSSTITTTTNSTNSARISFRRPFHMYCHTHGLCAHNGHKCRDPGPNHKKEAAFFNRMNGNDRNVDKAIKTE